MTSPPIHRPFAGGDIPLSDAQLAQIGLAVVYEAAAKMVAASMLKAIQGLSDEQWVSKQYDSLASILKALSKSSRSLDGELFGRIIEFERERSKSHDLRHKIVHCVWGYGGSGDSPPIAYDFSANQQLTPDDIERAVEGCAKLKRASTWAARRVAELIEDGVLSERRSGDRGMGVYAGKRTMRF